MSKSLWTSHRMAAGVWRNYTHGRLGSGSTPCLWVACIAYAAFSRQGETELTTIDAQICSTGAPLISAKMKNIYLYRVFDIYIWTVIFKLAQIWF
jgi:hypothetical protein